MKVTFRLKRIVAFSSVPILLLVFGTLGLLLQPSNIATITITTGDISGLYTSVAHGVQAPVEFKNFLPNTVSQTNRAIYAIANYETEYWFKEDDILNLESVLNHAGRFELTFAGDKGDVTLRYDFSSQQMLPPEQIQDYDKYLNSFQPQICYRRSAVPGRFWARGRDKTETEIPILDDEVVSLLGYPTAPELAQFSVLHDPTVNFHLGMPELESKRHGLLWMSVPQMQVSNAKGVVTIGKSKFLLDVMDTLSVQFREEEVEVEYAESGDLTKFTYPEHTLVVESKAGAWYFTNSGRPEEIRLNGEDLQANLFAISGKWFWLALVGGVIAGGISIYFDFVRGKLKNTAT